MLQEMYQEEMIVTESEKYISSQYAQVDNEIAELLERFEDEDDRLAGMEDLIRQEQKEQERRDKIAANALLLDRDDVITDMSHAGSINPATIDPRYVKKEQLPRGGYTAATEPAAQAFSSSPVNSALTSEEIDREVEETTQKMMYTFAAFSLVMLIVGLSIGTLCIYCIFKKFRTEGGSQAANSKAGIPYRADSTDMTDSCGVRAIPAVEGRFQTQADNQVMDTQEEDLQAEEKDEVPHIDCTDEDEEDIGKILEKRGLNFVAPRDRRSTY